MKVVILILLFAVAGCASVERSARYLYDNIEITWRASEVEQHDVIDSIVVRFNPVYWRIEQNNDIDDELEFEFYDAGYRVWMLETPQNLRYEVQKLDTVIYIYKRKLK